MIDIEQRSNHKDKIKEEKKEENSDYNIELEIINAFNNDIKINEAKQYNVELKGSLSFKEFYLQLSGIKQISNFDVLINGFSVISNSFSKKYLQQNSFFLTEDSFLNEEINVLEQVKMVSVFYCGFDLSEAATSSFLLKELREKKIKFLTKTEKKMLILSYVVACPAVIWFIDGNLLKELNKEQIEIFKNAVSIRVKHGGVILIINHSS